MLAINASTGSRGRAGGGRMAVSRGKRDGVVVVVVVMWGREGWDEG